MSAVRFARIFALILVGQWAIAGEDATVLLQAVRNNNLDLLKKHLNKASVNSRDDHGATLLMHASLVGTPQAMRILLDAGADVNARNAFEATALVWAARDPAKVSMLLAHGADVNVQSKQGRTPLIVAAQSNQESVRLLLAQGADVKARDDAGITPLMNAALAGDLASVRAMVDKGADVNAEASLFQDFGSTPLMAAACSSNPAIVRYLIAKGAKIQTVSNNSVEVRNGLLGMFKMTALMKAAPDNRAEVFEALLEAGADLKPRDVREMNVLMLAVASERADPRHVALLLKAGADPNARSALGETSLDWALKFGNPEIISMLRQAGGHEGDPYVKPSLHRPEFAPTPQEAIRKSLPLLQRSSTVFFERSGCVGCHHQPSTARAVEAAKSAGMGFDQSAAQDQQKAIRVEDLSQVELLRQGIELGGATDRLTQSLLGLHAYDPRQDAMTDTVVAEIADGQQPDGRWHFGGISRAPSGESEISRTAYALRVLQLYSLPGRKAEFEERIRRARVWLQAATPVTTEDHTLRLLGLYWSGAEKARIREAAKGLLVLQRADGGWAGNKYLESDAYSTAVALAALQEATAPVGSAAATRGSHFLLSTQNEDGSWYVRSRAVKFQPYFQSGFPFDHDQWISATATAWAVVALAPLVGHTSATAQNR
jgi:ankyrin repeat protein